MAVDKQQSIPGLAESMAFAPGISSEDQAVSRTVLCIEGAPGSGKTRALAREALRLATEQTGSGKKALILAITTQNKRRVEHYLKLETAAQGASLKNIEVITFDGFFMEVLSRHRPDTAFQLLGELEAQVILNGILQETVPEGHPLKHASRHFSSATVFLDAIRQLQLKGLTPSDLENCRDIGERFELLKRVYDRYLQRLRAQGLLTFPDLPAMVKQLATSSPDILQQLQNMYCALLVDEAQELSAGHFDFLQNLLLPLVFAGNKQLSIRSFRGAEPEMFSGLSEHFSDLERCLLTECPRKNEAVLSLVNAWLPYPIVENPVPDENSLQETVRFGLYRDPESEAAGIADFILAKKTIEQTLEWRDFAVLLRSAAYKPYLLNAFIQKNIPVMLDGFPDGLIHTQHVVYDWLNILQAFETLRIPVNFNQLQTHLASLNLPSAELEETILKANQHLSRWVAALLEDSPTDELRQTLNLLSQSEEALLLAQLMKAELLTPGLQKLLSELQADYQAYQDNTPVCELLKKSFENVLEESAELAAFIETIEILSNQYQKTCGQSLPLAMLLDIYPSLWQQENPKDSENRVRVLSIHQTQGDEFPYVIIPFLVHEEFPQNRQRSELLSTQEQKALLDQYGIQWRFNNDEAEEQRLLATGLSRACREILLTTHQAEGGKPVLPSQFYKSLLDAKRRLLNQKNPLHACWCESPDAYQEEKQANYWVDFCSHQLQESAHQNAEQQHQKSTWASLPKQEAEPLYADQAYLQISASSIKLYMECPRKYYYKQTLRLPEGDSYAANLGLLIHSLMEVFNLKAGEHPYTAEALKELADIMFDFENTEAFSAAGFGQDMYESLSHMNALALADLQNSLMEAIDDLEAHGYFDDYAKPQAIEAEMELNDIVIDGIERTLFRGKIDAMIQRRDGTWDIIDYKTYQPSKFNTKNSQAHFLATLDPLPDEDCSHKARFQDKLHSQYPKDYQLPLYYLATRNHPKYQGKINGVAMQLLRPPFKDNGSIRLEIPAAAIDAMAEQMIADINTHIVQPILEARDLPMNPDRTVCGYCSYARICESNGGNGEGGFAE